MFMICTCSDIQLDIICIDYDRYGLQYIADTGAGDAFTGIDHEQRVMRGALYELFIQVEKLVFLPFQAGAGMRTLIVIGKKFAILVYHEDGPGFTIDLYFETFTAGVVDITGFAENVGHNVC